MTDTPGPTPPMSRHGTVGRVLGVAGLVLLGGGGAFVVLGLLTLVFGDAMVDAAPWWLFFMLVGLCLAVPGGLVVLVLRLRARWPRLGATASDPPAELG